jgi:cytochrome c-type biogenesis protein CcmE
VKLKLYVIKKGSQQTDSDIQLVVVDLDKSSQYPLNFVCVLPRYFRLLEKRSSKFAKTFGPKSLVLAKRLLVEADKKEDDPQIKKVINKRIKDLTFKQECQKQL